MTTSSVKQLDFQAYGNLEKYLYGGQGAFSYFNKDIKKTMPLSRHTEELGDKSGSSNFSYNWSTLIDNSLGDYLTNLTLEVTIPEITLIDSNVHGENGTIRWTNNLLHNLIEEITLTFNDQVVSRLDSYLLDIISEFDVDENKFGYYQKMIGNIPVLTNPSTKLPSKTLILPLPLFFCKESWNAIPLTILPHTEIKVNLKFRTWENLLIVENKTSLESVPLCPVLNRDLEKEPQILSSRVLGTFIAVSDDERKRMSLKPKLLKIHQYQISPRQMFSEKKTSMSLSFKNSVNSIYFVARNSTYKNVLSNYGVDNENIINGIVTGRKSESPILNASIKYAGRDRVVKNTTEYFHYIEPYYYNTRIPSEGFHTYNFSLDDSKSDACGGVSLNRIDNPTIHVELVDGLNEDNSYELIVAAKTTNIMRVQEGIVVFPAVN